MAARTRCNLDGLGGTHVNTSKVMIIQAARPRPDVNTRGEIGGFAIVDYQGMRQPLGRVVPTD